MIVIEATAPEHRKISAKAAPPVALGVQHKGSVAGQREREVAARDLQITVPGEMLQVDIDRAAVEADANAIADRRVAHLEVAPVGVDPQLAIEVANVDVAAIAGDIELARDSLHSEVATFGPQLGIHLSRDMQREIHATPAVPLMPVP